MNSWIALLKKMGLEKMILVAGSLLAVITLFIFILIKYSEPDFIILYDDLEINDSNKIVNYLEQRGIEYNIKASGRQILVPNDKVLKIRMDLAQEGIPNTGNIVGYEIFDNSDSISTSSFVQNVHLVRALEGELARTITSFNQVKKARVHLVIPKRELFSRDYQQPTASVILEMRSSNALSKEETNAISHLVATAVPSLDVNKITIVDTKGRSLKLSVDSEQESSGLNSSIREYHINYENNIKKVIEDMLERIVGSGGVEVQVSAEMNFDRIVTNSEIYDPDGQVVRSTQTIEEKEANKETSGNKDASIINNIPNAPGGNNNDVNSNSSLKTDETVNYEISKTIRNHIRETGTVKRLSIAVLVDGNYEFDEETQKKIYKPRSNNELEQLKKLVMSAVGYNEERKDRIEIVNLQFKQFIDDNPPKETIIDWLKIQLHGNLYSIVKLFALVVTALLIVILFIKPFINRVFDAATTTIQAQIDAEVAIAKAEAEKEKIKNTPPKEESVIEIKSPLEKEKIKRNRTFKSVNDIAEQCPQETLMILRNWLNS